MEVYFDQETIFDIQPPFVKTQLCSAVSDQFHNQRHFRLHKE